METKTVIKKMTIKDINQILKSIDIEPLLEYDEPTELDEKMKFGLAQVYTDEGYRKYMKNAINIATKNAALSNEDSVSVAFHKGRIIALKEMFIKSKAAFEKFKPKLIENAKGKKT